jgi:hypothetical protein
VTRLLIVDLRALQPATVIDVDALPFREEVQGRRSCLAVTVSSCLGAAKGEMYLRSRGARVDVQDAGEDVLHRPECGVDIGGEDRGGESVLDAVDDADRLIEGWHWNDSRYGPEDLLLRDPPVGGRVVEDRRLVEIAPAQVAFGGNRAAGYQARAFLLADLDVPVDRLQLAVADHRADVDSLVEPVAQPHLRCARRKPVDEFTLN